MDLGPGVKCLLDGLGDGDLALTPGLAADEQSEVPGD